MSTLHLSAWATAACVVLSVTTSAHAETYHVATTGSDANPGTEAAPFQTITYGASQLAAGDTLVVHAGTYAEGLYNGFVGGSSWDAPTVLQAAEGEAVTMAPPAGADRVFTLASAEIHHVIIRGFILDAAQTTYDAIKITWGSATEGSHHIRFEDCEVMNAPAQGILITGGDHGVEGNELIRLAVHHNGTTDFDHGLYISTPNNVVEGCEIYANAGWGVHVYSEGHSDATNGTVVRGNFVHDNGRVGDRGPGIGIYSGVGLLAINNVVWSNTLGITVNYGAADVGIFNNTVSANLDEGIYVGTEASGVTLRNNIVWGNGGGITDEGQGTTIGINFDSGDPRFVDPQSAQFSLQSDSPAIDTGETVVEVTADIEGVTRPQGEAYDHGAYEFHVDAPGGGGAGPGGHGGTEPGGSSAAGHGGDSAAGAGGAEANGESGGCGCTLAGSSPSWRGWALVSLALGLAFRRRSRIVAAG